jgi:hypothetical protein
VDRRGVFKQLLLDAVAVEPGEYHQLERDRSGGETARLEVSRVQLHVGASDAGQWFKVVKFTPAEPET